MNKYRISSLLDAIRMHKFICKGLKAPSLETDVFSTQTFNLMNILSSEINYPDSLKLWDFVDQYLKDKPYNYPNESIKIDADDFLGFLKLAHEKSTQLN